MLKVLQKDDENASLQSFFTPEGIDTLVNHGNSRNGLSGIVSPHSHRMQRKKLIGNKLVQVNLKTEFERLGSHADAREIVKNLSIRNNELKTIKEEQYQLHMQNEKFLTWFAETRLATCGTPTANTVSKRIQRQRQKTVLKTGKLGSSEEGTLEHLPNQSHNEKKIQHVIRESLGTGNLDLKRLDLVELPPYLYNTLLLQFSRCVTEITISHNKLQEIPSRFVTSFLAVQSLNYNENSLIKLPNELMHLKELTHLNIECNQLVTTCSQLPPTLKYLNLGRNRLHALPNLHLLNQLTELDLSCNQFTAVPAGTICLTKLKLLSVKNNRLLTLALFPRMNVKPISQPDEQFNNIVELSLAEQKKQWRIEVDDVTKEKVYFHIPSKIVTRAKPTCFDPLIPRLKLPTCHARIATVAPKYQFPQQQCTSLPQTPSKIEICHEDWEITTSYSAVRNCAYIEYKNTMDQETYNYIPPELDQFGRFQHLQMLCVAGNQLLDLPPSISQMPNLKELDAENNKLTEIPDTFANLLKLEVLKLGMNELFYIPHQLTNLPKLHDLDLHVNRIKRLPDDIGNLIQLTAFNISNNDLENLPLSMLQLKKLKDLKIQNNPKLIANGQFKASIIATGNISQIMWELNHQHLCQKRERKPPEPQIMLTGIAKECWTTNLNIKNEFSKAIEDSISSKILSYHWKGLEIADFPPTFYTSLETLEELRLCGHNLPNLPKSFNFLTNLKLMQIRNNKIIAIDDDIFQFTNSSDPVSHTARKQLDRIYKLEELDVENNELSTFPGSIGNLQNLKILRASNNDIVSCPSSIQTLKHLTKLILAHNRIQNFPEGIQDLVSLTTLDLSSNAISSIISVNFAKLQKLATLNLNRNKLTDLPSSLAKCPIKELQIAGNEFSILPLPIIQLAETLDTLNYQSNHIAQLPTNFCELIAIKIIKSGGNPCTSPPPEIMQASPTVIRKYLNIRQQRVDEITRLLILCSINFDNKVFALPKLRNLIVRPTLADDDKFVKIDNITTTIKGSCPKSLQFLSDQNILSLEDELDKYVNKSFYKSTTLQRGVDILFNNLISLQFKHAQHARRIVIDAVLNLCEIIHQNRWLDKQDFRYDCKRPWGRNGEQVAVYMIKPSAIYTDTSTLPSILSVLQSRCKNGFDSEIFSYSVWQVEDAIANYISIYGPVGVVHEHVPFQCGCEDLLQQGKMHLPCYQPGWTVVANLLTEEEACRRNVEDAKIHEALLGLRPQIESFLKSKVGQKRLYNEIKTMKDALRVQLNDINKKISKGRKKYNLLSKNLNKLKKDHRKELNIITKPEKVVLENPPFPVHFEADDEVTELTSDVEYLKERLEEWTNARIETLKQLRSGYECYVNKVVDILMETAGAEMKEKILDVHRTIARKNYWRRPWDDTYHKQWRHGTWSFENQKHEDIQELIDGQGISEDMEDNNSEISDVSFGEYDFVLKRLDMKLKNADMNHTEESQHREHYEADETISRILE